MSNCIGGGSSVPSGERGSKDDSRPPASSAAAEQCRPARPVGDGGAYDHCFDWRQLGVTRRVLAAVTGLDALPDGWRKVASNALSSVVQSLDPLTADVLRIDFRGRSAVLHAPNDCPLFVVEGIQRRLSEILDTFGVACFVCGRVVARGRSRSRWPTCAEHRGEKPHIHWSEGRVHLLIAPPRPAVRSRTDSKSSPARVATAEEPTPAVPVPRKPHPGRTLRIYDERQMVDAIKAIKANAGNDDTRSVELLRPVQQHGGEAPYVGVPKGLDIERVCRELRQEMPNFALVIEQAIRPGLVRARLTGRLALPRVLVHGAPGSGKTRLWRRLCELLNWPFVRLDMATIDMAAAVVGSDARWSNTREGEVFRVLTRGCGGLAPVANPLVIVEEIDKVLDGDRYPVAPALLMLLEPSTAARFEDRSVPNVYLNASAINWVFTANWVQRINGPLRSRCIEYEIAPLSQAERIVAAQTVVREVTAEWRADQVEFEPAIDRATALALAQQPLRQMRQCVDLAITRALEAGRRRLGPSDVVPLTGAPERSPIGFH